MKALLVLACLLCSNTALFAQDLLQSGPMVGYSDMREAMLWVQTKAEATVYFVYYDSADASHRFRTNVVQTTAQSAFTAHCVADSVEAGKRYMYEVYVNNQLVKRPYPTSFRTPPLWQWRSDPPPLRILFGSCAYVNETVYDRPGNPYGAEYQIFTAMAAMKPDMTLWLGDNVYLREADWNTRTGILKRYTHTRSLPEMQPLLANSANYAIWDDHDYGPNDYDRSFWNKEQSYDAFKTFWANQRYGINNQSGGINSVCSWGDVDVFFLDNRWWRTPDRRKTGERFILGKEQLEWLIDGLVSSTASFKVICIGGQVLNSEALFENYACYAEERKKLLDAIHAEKISGVIFLSGDRHHTEFSMLKETGQYPIYDLTASPLTSGPNPRAEKEPNAYRIPGTFVGQRNFAMMELSGTKEKRAISFSVYDSSGKQLWTKTISLKEMKEN